MPYAITSPELGEVLLEANTKSRLIQSGGRGARESFKQRRGGDLVTEDPDAFPPIKEPTKAGRT